MQTTEETVSELRDRISEATVRRNDLSVENFDLQQKLKRRDIEIHLLKSKKSEMEGQLRWTIAERQEALATLATANDIAQLLEDKKKLVERERDRLNSEIKHLTQDLNATKLLQQQQNIDTSLLRTQLQQGTVKYLEKEFKICVLKRDNQVLYNELEILRRQCDTLKNREQQTQVTLEEKDNEITELKMKLELAEYQNRHALLNNLQHCSRCRSIETFACEYDKVVRELELMQQDYNHMKVDNNELNQQLISSSEVNAQLKYELANLEKTNLENCTLLKSMSKVENKTVKTLNKRRKAPKRQVEPYGPNEPVHSKRKRSLLDNAVDTSDVTKNFADRVTEANKDEEKSAADGGNEGRSFRGRARDSRNRVRNAQDRSSRSKKKLTPRAISTPEYQTHRPSADLQSITIHSEPEHDMNESVHSQSKEQHSDNQEDRSNFTKKFAERSKDEKKCAAGEGNNRRSPEIGNSRAARNRRTSNRASDSKKTLPPRELSIPKSHFKRPPADLRSFTAVAEVHEEPEHDRNESVHSQHSNNEEDVKKKLHTESWYMVHGAEDIQSETIEKGDDTNHTHSKDQNNSDGNTNDNSNESDTAKGHTDATSESDDDADVIYIKDEVAADDHASPKEIEDGTRSCSREPSEDSANIDEGESVIQSVDETANANGESETSDDDAPPIFKPLHAYNCRQRDPVTVSNRFTFTSKKRGKVGPQKKFNKPP